VCLDISLYFFQKIWHRCCVVLCYVQCGRIKQCGMLIFWMCFQMWQSMTWINWRDITWMHYNSMFVWKGVCTVEFVSLSHFRSWSLLLFTVVPKSLTLSLGCVHSYTRTFSYAKYYFELRSLSERDPKHFPLKPLDKEGQLRLEVIVTKITRKDESSNNNKYKYWKIVWIFCSGDRKGSKLKPKKLHEVRAWMHIIHHPHPSVYITKNSLRRENKGFQCIVANSRTL
jgi:hypothetical protein